MRKVVGLLAGLCLCAGCENELPESAQSAVSTGQFVVDYTAGASVATRMIHESQTKGVRINSLTYLLYNSEGTLEKRREIPGLAGDEETWPLTRANMTWEQREALKDTLYQEETYHVVFVANIDSAICGWKNADSALWSPLRETESYKTVHLQMPYQPFNDRNMFYVFTQEVHSTDQKANRDNPYNCPVVLRRAVTRTDFLFEQLPVWVEKSEEGGTETPGEGTEENPAMIYPVACTLPDTIKSYFISDFYNMVLSTHREELSQPVVDATVDLLDALELYFAGQILIPDLNLPLKDKYTKYNTRLYAIEDSINGNGKYDFMDKINMDKEKEEGDVLSKFQIHLIYTLLNELEQNTAIRELFTQSTHRALGTFATIDYEGQSGVNKYYLSGKAPESSLEKSLRIEVDTTVMRENVSYLGFNWVGLADSEKNKIASVCWYQTADTTMESEKLTPKTIIFTEQGMNEKYSIYYQPIKELGLKKEWKDKKLTKQTQIICNLEAALPFTEGDQEMVKEINTLLSTNKIKGYSGSLGEMTLTIIYPDVTKSEVLEIKEAWEISKE